MYKLLLIGTNTRSMLTSALKLDYSIYSTSYFSTSDAPSIKNQKIILKEELGESCGKFKENFNSQNILDISKEYIDEVDYIIPISGISPTEFPKKIQKKILGSVNVENIEDKYKFYKEIKEEFKTPETFLLNDVDEAFEIKKNNPNTQYILKPIKGSGGYGVNILNNDKYLQVNSSEKFILQEYVEGINLSSSIMANKNNKKIITNSRLLTINDFKKNNNYLYVGNILPLTNKSIIKNMKNINKITEEMKVNSEKLAYKFDLIGSNGIDYILNKNGLYVIEINPRIQGTFECIEKSFGINMIESHIKSCLNEEVTIPKAKHYSYKKIIYSPFKTKYEKINLDNIYDLPHIGSTTEQSEPLLTIIDKDKNFENLLKKVDLSYKTVINHLKNTQ